MGRGLLEKQRLQPLKRGRVIREANKWFIYVAIIVCMVFVVTTVVCENFVLILIQAHLDVVSWLSLAVFGIAYHLYLATQNCLTAAKAGGEP